MPVDKDSPHYADYIAACKTLFDDASKREREYLAEYPDWIGQDHPNSGKIRVVMDERNRRFHELQERYGFAD